MLQIHVFTSGWAPLFRILLVGIPMYVALVVLLRISGSRTLASMNAFDFIVTVAIGSVFGRALTAKAVALTEALVALALLISLQYVVGLLQVRSERFHWAVTNPPRLLYYRDQFMKDTLHRQRVTQSELRAAVRKSGFGSLDEVDAIVLETSGEFSVVESIDEGTAIGGPLEEQRPEDAVEGGR